MALVDPTSRNPALCISARLAAFSTNTRETSFQKPASLAAFDERLHRRAGRRRGRAATRAAYTENSAMPGVALARPVFRRRRKRHDRARLVLDRDDRKASVEPLLHVVHGPRTRLERRDAVLDPLVVDCRDGFGVDRVSRDRARMVRLKLFRLTGLSLYSTQSAMKTFVSPSAFRVAVRREHELLAVRREHREPVERVVVRHALEAGAVDIDQIEIEIAPLRVVDVRREDQALAVRMPRRREVRAAELRDLPQLAMPSRSITNSSSGVGRHSPSFSSAR